MMTEACDRVRRRVWIASVGGVEDRAALTPVQERTLELLRRPDEPLIFPEAFVDDLRTHVREALGDLSARLGGEKLFVSKNWLARVHGCEAHHLAPDVFEWNAQNAKGFVAHKAIELLLNWQGEAAPGTLVDEAIARLADSFGSRGDWVATLTDADRAELRGAAVERVTRFRDSFPPIPASASPLTEASIKFTAPGTIELGGKTDLVIGRLQGRESRRVIIDLKSGGKSPNHVHDLRFYALLETLVHRVPPRKLVTYYLDYAEAEIEDVTEDTLRTAARRTLDGIERHIEITLEGRDVVKRVGGACRWCPLNTSCAEGAEYLRGDQRNG